MAHSYIANYAHYVFSTKGRRPLIDDELRPRLWAYMAGIARENGIKPIKIGGTENHSHVLVSMPSTMTMAKAAQLIKAGASKWINEMFPSLDFQWQEGYGGFSVTPSVVPKTIAYIDNQMSHHRTKTFEEEYISILKACGVEYDLQHVFD